ncbi:MAG TPA: M23 family metallopeptidase, partial [Bacillota bacterium]|nr:M23 family metallopeptidase [Bacillota bacterium]
MGKYFIKALIFCILFFSVCGVIGLQEDFFVPEKAEPVTEPVTEPEPEPVPEIVFSETELLPGDCFAIYLKGLTERDDIKVSTAFVQGQPRFFSFMEGRLAVVGTSCRTKEGDYSCKVQVLRDGEIAAEKEETFKVFHKEFVEQHLTVTSTQKEQRSDDNFDMDKVHTERAKSVTSEKPLWEGIFVKPVEGRVSTEFGMIRYINKEESGRHSGIDIAAARGTPVKAANNGVVRLAMMLKVTGNTIIIDHGCNIYSSYAHLDKLLVEEGAEVKKGDIAFVVEGRIQS